MTENFDQQKLLSLLLAGLAELDLELPDGTGEKLIRLLELLHRWNQTYNLTAIRHSEQMVGRHLLDSLAVLPHLRGETYLDVGTGPGFPGLPLALALPNCQFDLLDSALKKTRFVLHAVANLNIENVRVVNRRVEQFVNPLGYDAILSRAFSSLAKLVECTSHLTKKSSRLFALKGRDNEDERQNLPEGYRVEKQLKFQVPGVEAERSLIVIIKSGT